MLRGCIRHDGYMRGLMPKALLAGETPWTAVVYQVWPFINMYHRYTLVIRYSLQDIQTKNPPIKTLSDQARRTRSGASSMLVDIAAVLLCSPISHDISNAYDVQPLSSSLAFPCALPVQRAMSPKKRRKKKEGQKKKNLGSLPR